ncbi:MAG: methylated-DNA--[protein]-cysteine S-methyltransferase [Gammaproteobacteria bacterium]|nr:methylated-DNA--[protein]-cysteine S-methyltransferase [Gammaproteobacteria bacterium]
MTIYYSYLASPIGDLLLAGDGVNLHLLGFPEGKMRTRHQEIWRPDDTVFAEVKSQLNAYFAGELQDFDLPLAPQGTEFQMSVWKALTTIPYGSTRSYGEIAGQVGKPKASRAVGAANGQNPIPIIIPCHRVSGCTGKLTGFGGGLPTQVAVGTLEQRHRPFQLSAS